MVFDDEPAAAAVQWAEQCQARWTTEHGTEDVSDNFLKDLLTTVVNDAVIMTGSARPITLGLSSGYDSRPILRVCWDLGSEPKTYTFGQPGNLDFDLVTIVAQRTGLGTHFIDTNTMEWSLATFDDLGTWDTNLLISPRVPAGGIINTLYPERIDIHGYLNDSLTGARRPPVQSGDWMDALQAFAVRNDQFGLQPLMAPTLPVDLLPRKPLLAERTMPFHRQLDIGYRQAQRIRPVSRGSPVWALPYEDDRWVGFWLSRQDEDLVQQRRWLQFVHGLDDELFFDLTPFPDDYSRTSLRRRRLEFIYRTEDGPGLVSLGQSGTMAFPENPTQHFSVKACYKNNHSFRSMVDLSIARINGRNVFYQAFVDSIWSRFKVGDPTGAKMLHGLLTVDIALEAGLFD